MSPEPQSSVVRDFISDRSPNDPVTVIADRKFQRILVSPGRTT